MLSSFDVLADANRRRILDLLRAGELPVGDLVRALTVSQPAISKHLRVLRDAGFVAVRTDGSRRMYRVRPDPLREIDAWLSPYRAMWQTSLDALERHLGQMPDEPAPHPDPRHGRNSK